MQATALKILTDAGKQIQLLTGNKIVAFVIEKKDKEKLLQEKIDCLKLAICQMFDVSWTQLFVKCRKSELVLARQLFFWYATDRIGMSLTDVAKILGKDHTTVIHGRDKIRDFLSIKDSYVSEKVSTLEMYLDFEPAL